MGHLKMLHFEFYWALEHVLHLIAIYDSWLIEHHFYHFPRINI